MHQELSGREVSPPSELPRAVLASLHTHSPWQVQGRSFTSPYLLDEGLLEEGNEGVGPWNVNVDLEKKVGYTHQLCFPGAQ